MLSKHPGTELFLPSHYIMQVIVSACLRLGCVCAQLERSSHVHQRQGTEDIMIHGAQARHSAGHGARGL